MLSVSDLRFAYGAREVLSGVSLRAGAGDFLALLGANGSGKSTLFKCILGILQPTAGSVQIASQAHLSAKERARIVSYVPQRSGLLMPLCVRDFILLGLFASKSGLFLGYSGADYAAANELCERFALPPAQDVRSLSGGEFGRALMARALISAPQIILLDEPTSAMDLAYAREIMGICAELAAGGICVVSIIHDLNLAAKYCSHFAMLACGRIAHFGGAELFRPEILREVFALECEVLEHQNRPLVAY